jgi:hypothetical protein
MNLYLSNGKKSIPIVVAFDDNQQEVFVWGFATNMQTTYAKSLQQQNLSFPEFIRPMQTWFVRNNALAIEQDFKMILESINTKK